MEGNSKTSAEKPQYLYSVARQFHDPSGRTRVIESPCPKEVADLAVLATKAFEKVAFTIPIEGKYSAFRGRHDWQIGAYWIEARDCVNRLADRLKLLADGSNRAQLGWLSLAQNAARWELRDTTYALSEWIATIGWPAAGLDTRPDLPADLFQRFVFAVEALLREFPSADPAISQPNTSGAMNIETAKAGGRTVATDEYEDRKRVFERYEQFEREYKNFRYSRDSYDNFAAWASEQFDDMPSDDPAGLKRMVDAHRKTPTPRKLI